MASPRQIAANRRNALRSTGPRSPSGKARARTNALQHGFSAATILPPELDQQAFELARHIAAEMKTASLAEALSIAGAQLYLMRIRRARQLCLETLAASLGCSSCVRDGRRGRSGTRQPGLPAIIRGLAALERYMSAAISRRRRATDEFLAA